MRSDNSIHLTTAAKQRHELTRAKAIAALHDLDRAGAKITFEAVADHAGVSRSWLYTQTDLKDEIRRLRARNQPQHATPTPARQRASDDSLRQRLDLALRRNRELADREPAAAPPTRPRSRPAPRHPTPNTSRSDNNRPLLNPPPTTSVSTSTTPSTTRNPSSGR